MAMINRQRRIHIQIDSDTESDTENNEAPNKQNDILPVSNRNIIEKIKSMQSIDFEKEKEKTIFKHFPIKVNTNKKEKKNKIVWSIYY